MCSSDLIGLGLWWADSVAALVIAADILHDGQRYLRESISDLMDEWPRTYDEAKPHPAAERVKEEIAAVPWIAEAAVRMREHGHTITGDVWVVPVGTEEALVQRLEDLGERLRKLDWRVHDVVVAPVTSLEEVPEDLRVEGRARRESG